MTEPAKRATALPPAPRARSIFLRSILGLAPQALCCRPLRGLGPFLLDRSWGLRPRLYAAARSAGSVHFSYIHPGLAPPGFMLPPAPRARFIFLTFILGLRPQALCCRFADSVLIAAASATAGGAAASGGGGTRGGSGRAGFEASARARTRACPCS